MNHVLSVCRSKVRNAGIEIYHFKHSEKFQGHWKCLQRSCSFYSWFYSEKCHWPEGETATAVVAENLTRNAGINFDIILTIRHIPVCVTLTAVKWQTEVRKILLSLGAEYFVLQFAFQKNKIKINKTVIFPAGLYVSKIGLWYLERNLAWECW